MKSDGVGSPSSNNESQGGASSSKKSSKRREVFKEIKRDAPENPNGIYIRIPETNLQEPRDFLLIARVVKRNCRPLTVAEVQHQKRSNILFKLDNEIK